MTASERYMIIGLLLNELLRWPTVVHLYLKY
jgi:hypothetical protein